MIIPIIDFMRVSSKIFNAITVIMLVMSLKFVNLQKISIINLGLQMIPVKIQMLATFIDKLKLKKEKEDRNIRVIVNFT